MEFDPVLLSRLQFAFTVSFHILFPTLTIGLASYIAFLEAMWLWKRREIHLLHCKFWSKVFALTFGMGVVSGIVLSYEFGTNFAPFSTATGNVLGPLLSYEVLTAFFLEAGFLGVMLFGWNRVGPRLHFLATLLVAIGTLVSTFWILAANSWMHTPAGAVMENGVFIPKDWFEIVFNPSFPYRFTHMGLASFLTTATFVTGVSAWMILRRKSGSFFSLSLRNGIYTMALIAPLQILAGDLHGLNTLEHQPMKVAAMEGRWETMSGAPLLLFAWPDSENETNHFEIGIPKGASYILKHDPDATILGLKEVPPADRPNVPLVFWSFRIMVGIGLLLLLLGFTGSWFAWRRKLEDSPRLLKALAWSTPLGFVAVLTGWWVTETGRQPWLVQGLYRTADGASVLPAGEVLASLLIFIVLYAALFAAYLYYLSRVILRADSIAGQTGEQPHAPSRPAFVDIGEEEEQ